MQMLNKGLDIELSEEVRRKLQVGKTVEVWWPRHRCSYEGTISEVSQTHVTLMFDDGSLKVMRVPTVAQRIAAAEVWGNVIMVSVLSLSL